MKRISFIVLFALSSSLILSQEQLKSSGCIEIEDKDLEYVIRVNGADYQDESDIFTCISEPELSISILYAETLVPVEGIEWNWSKCECTPDDINEYEAILVQEDYGNDTKAKIEVRFEEDMEGHVNWGETIKLVGNVRAKRVEYSDHNNSAYLFDKNKHFPLKVAKVPLKYIPNGESDFVNIKPKPGKAYPEISISSEEPNLVISPSVFSDDNKQEAIIDLSNVPPINTGDNLIEVSSCERDLILFRNSLSEINVEVFYVCENDDDLQVNLGEVASSQDVCVAPGPDGLLDEYNSVSSKTWYRHKNDEVKMINGTYHIIAGEKKVDGKYVCETEANPPDIKCPNIIPNLADKLEEVKLFYEDFNVNLNFDIKGNLIANYDSWKEDYKFHSSTLEDDELKIFSDYYVDGEDPKLFIVKTVTGSNGGTSGVSQTGQGVSLVQNNHELPVWTLTVAHELGHGIGGLRHPQIYGDSGLMGNFMFWNHNDQQKLQHKKFKVFQIRKFNPF